MTAPKLTPWFPAHVDPVRPGKYRVWRKVGSGYPAHSWLMWDGSWWRHTDHSRAGAMCVGCPANMNSADGDKWRGLTREA